MFSKHCNIRWAAGEADAMEILTSLTERRCSWANLNLGTCTTFYTSNMVPEYEDPGSVQWMAKVMNNIGYNWRKFQDRMFEKVWVNASFTNEEEKDYCTSYSFMNAGLSIIVDRAQVPGGGSFIIPTPTFDILTTSYQTFIHHQDDYSLTNYKFQVKYLAAGGIRIKNVSIATQTLKCGIIRYTLPNPE